MRKVLGHFLVQSQSFRFLSKILLGLTCLVYFKKNTPKFSTSTKCCLVAFQRNQEAVEHSLRAKLKDSELGRETDLVLRKESFLKKILVSMEYWRNFFPLDHDTCHHLHLFLSQKRYSIYDRIAILFIHCENKHYFL